MERILYSLAVVFSASMMRAMVLLLALPAAAEGPVVDVDSRTVFLGGTVRRVDPLSGEVAAESAATLLEIERIEARSLSSGPILRRLTLHQSGWLLGDVATETRSGPVTGNLRTLYAEWTGGWMRARLGRQIVVGGATRFAHLDGASVRLLAPLGLDVSAHGGLIVLPQMTSSPYYARLGDRLDPLIDPRVHENALLDPRTARGFALVGGRLSETVPGWGRVGVSFVHELEAGQLARQGLGFDAALERERWPRLESSALVDLPSRGLAEARVFLDVGPYAGLTVTPSYRLEDPTLLVSKTSIFSAFQSTAYHETGAELLWSHKWLALSGGGFFLAYPDDHTGARARATAAATRGSRRPVSARASYERVSAPGAEDRGYHGGSAGMTVSGLGPARVSAELYAFLFDKERETGSRASITPQVSAGASVSGIDLDGALGWHSGPEVRSGLFGMVKAGVPMSFAPGRSGWQPERLRQPPQKPAGDRLKFSHKTHIDVAVECLDCHVDAKDAAAGVRLLPKEETCIECHEEGRLKENCNLCHTDPAKPQALPRPERGLRFAHSKHTEKNECVFCHAKAPTTESPDVNLIPGMDVCFSCHEHKDHFANLRCDACHEGRIEGPMPTADFFSHSGDWRRRHQDVAKSKSDVCGACHDASFCLDCHERNAPAVPAAIYAERPGRAAFHRGWFLDRHADEARAEPASCLRCHGRTSCDSCHLESGVSGIVRDAVSPHPRLWIEDGHARAARRDLVACIGCHDQGAASNCVLCHRVGGSGGSPHGAGFTSALERDGSRVCRVCHAGVEP